MPNARRNGNCVLIGGGGHARVLIDSLRQSGNTCHLAVLDNDPSLKGKAVAGVDVIGTDQMLPDLARQGFEHFIVGLGSTGDCSPRQRLFLLASEAGLSPLTVRHPSACVSALASIGAGAQILPMAVINAHATIGANTIINSGAIVEHDCILGDHVHVATGATLSSTVSVGDCTHIGAGATVRQCIKIGDHSVVGAGAVVVSDVPPGATVVGVPAKILENKRSHNAR